MNSHNDLPAEEAPENPDQDADAKADALADMEREVEAEAAAMEAEAEAAEDDASGESDDDKIAALEAQVADLNDKLLRAVADSENTRRIATREKADAGKYAVTNFARDIVRVADNLSMAMMSVTDEAREAGTNLNNLFVGIDMTMKELLNVFDAHGIKPVAAEGQPFDHNVHEAVQQVENPEVPKNTVLQVLRGGFTIQDRLLRPAQVIVSTGGPKAESEGEEASGEDAPGEGGQQAYEPGAAQTGQTVDQET